MAQEVYAVMFINEECYDCCGIECYSRVELLRQVFDSLEKARAYCENPDHYADEFSEAFLKEFKPSWNDSKTVYILLENDNNVIYFSIETRNLL